MKNKKGFTLIELLAVIAIIALISLIAIPNIVGLSDSVRKDNMLDDAKKLISMAKYKVNSDYEIRNFTKSGVCSSGVCTMYFNDLNTNGDLNEDVDGGTYSSTSYVKYYKSGTEITYCVALMGSKRHIGSVSSCKEERELYSRSNVVDN